jgi:hypothetical protein
MWADFGHERRGAVAARNTFDRASEWTGTTSFVVMRWTGGLS